jgi:hypothetical protein
MAVAHRRAPLVPRSAHRKCDQTRPTVTSPRRTFGTSRRQPVIGSQSGLSLTPGEPVLTRGVSRRWGSLAYIREGASANDWRHASLTIRRRKAARKRASHSIEPDRSSPEIRCGPVAAPDRMRAKSARSNAQRHIPNGLPSFKECQSANNADDATKNHLIVGASSCWHVRTVSPEWNHPASECLT